MKTGFILFAICLNIILPAQTLPIKQYQDSTLATQRKLLPIPSGGYYVLGTKTIWPNEQVELTRIDASGNAVWVKSYSFFDSTGLSPSVYTARLCGVRLENGTIVFAGGLSWDNSPIPQYYGNQSILVCVDSSGNLLWNHIANNLTTSCEYYDVVETPEHDILLTGAQMVNFSSGVFGMGITKYDQSGNLIWNKIHTLNSGYEVSCRIRIKPNGNYLAVGDNRNVVALLEVDTAGHLVNSNISFWNGRSVRITSIDVGADGRVLVGGDFQNPNVSIDALLLSYDNQLMMNWARTWNVANHAASVTCVKLKSNNKYIWQITQQANASLAYSSLVETDSLAAINWQKQYSFSSQTDATDMVFTPNGILNLVNNINDYNGILFETDANGLLPCFEQNEFGTTTNLPNINLNVVFQEIDQPIVDFPGIVQAITRTIPTLPLCQIQSESENRPLLETHVFPNPTSDAFVVTINHPIVSEVTLQLFDIEGHLIASQVAGNLKAVNTIRMDVSAYAKGMYVLKVSSEVGASVMKVIVE